MHELAVLLTSDGAFNVPHTAYSVIAP